MKKLRYFLSVMILFFAISPSASAKNPTKEKQELTDAEQNRLDEIEKRVEEIKALDFSDLNKEEKRDVKMELKEMKKEARALGGGVYISVGAIIIILLLLILLT
ncbi:hypothetical protein EF405_18095 [Cyclobacteriaceae bacterium YHN15]|nr:hypothetical protein EF405_18095 [Cyclobacteriaceae bacterium YHN15]